MAVTDGFTSLRLGEIKIEYDADIKKEQGVLVPLKRRSEVAPDMHPLYEWLTGGFWLAEDSARAVEKP